MKINTEYSVWQEKTICTVYINGHTYYGSGESKTAAARDLKDILERALWASKNKVENLEKVLSLLAIKDVIE